MRSLDHIQKCFGRRLKTADQSAVDLLATPEDLTLKRLDRVARHDTNEIDLAAIVKIAERRNGRIAVIVPARPVIMEDGMQQRAVGRMSKNFDTDGFAHCCGGLPAWAVPEMAR